MKRTALVLLIILISFSALMAHPPSAVTAKLEKGGMLRVTFVHDISKFPQNHYIKTIDVTLNGQPLILQTNYSQENKQGGGFLYKVIDAKPGSKIAVTATCSIQGSKTAELTIK